MTRERLGIQESLCEKAIEVMLCEKALELSGTLTMLGVLASQGGAVVGVEGVVRKIKHGLSKF
uniref:Uncharacterized protein n=1 Tax=Cucumis melo TaxID=3656 RepID=A0A9I9CK84_CUCME